MAPKDDLRVNLSTDRLSRIKCMECGHKNPGDVAFCTKCRAKMVLEGADCGFKSPQGSEFCGSCGKETEFRVEKMARNAALAAEAEAAAEAAAEAVARDREAAEAEAAEEEWARLRPIKSYFDNGQLQVRGCQKDDKWDGPYESYQENGQLWKKATYTAGELDGLFKEYYPNGQLRVTGTYKDGEWDGPYEYCTSLGQIIEKGTYNMGERCGEWIQEETGFLGSKTSVTVTFPPC